MVVPSVSLTVKRAHQHSGLKTVAEHHNLYCSNVCLLALIIRATPNRSTSSRIGFISVVSAGTALARAILHWVRWGTEGSRPPWGLNLR